MAQTEWKYQRVDLADNITTIEAVPCLVRGVYVNTTTSAHACEIKDSTSNAFTIPASATAGNFYDWVSVRFETSLVVDPDDTGTGSISILYTKLREDFA